MWRSRGPDSRSRPRRRLRPALKVRSAARIGNGMPRRQGGQAGRVRVQRPPEALPLPSVAALSRKAARLSGQRDRRTQALVSAFLLLPDLPERGVTVVHRRTSRARRGRTDRPDRKNRPPRPSPIAWAKLQHLSRSVGSGGSSAGQEFHREQPAPMNLSRIQVPASHPQPPECRPQRCRAKRHALRRSTVLFRTADPDRTSGMRAREVRERWETGDTDRSRLPNAMPREFRDPAPRSAAAPRDESLGWKAPPYPTRHPPTAKIPHPPCPHLLSNDDLYPDGRHIMTGFTSA